MRLLPLAVWSIAAACTSPPERTRPPPHFDEWERLVRASVAGRADVVHTVARTLEGPDADGIGSAVGFLQVAEPDEVVLGTVRLAEACGPCHRRRGIRAPDRPAGTLRSLDGLVFGSASAEQVLAALREQGR